MVPRTVAELLAASRRRNLVGRDAELAVLRAFVGDPDRVLAYLHGPGGVGKSTMLDAFAGELGATDRTLIRLDCADLEPTTAGLLTALRARAGADSADLLPDSVLVVDRFEVVAPLEAWFWRSFLGALPAGLHVVVAGRRPPPQSWTADPAFTSCGLVLPLRNLGPGDAADLVRGRGVTDDATIDRLVRATHGHPLALVIAIEAGRGDDPSRGPGGGVLFDHPDVAARLLGRFLDEGVTPAQREALHVCGHARRVDRAMLRTVLDLDDAGADELLTWLRERPYAESHPDGLTLHEVVRDALDRDLRWRDRDAFVRLHSNIRQVILDRMASAAGPEHFRLAGDLLYMHRANPDAQRLYTFQDVGQVVARPLRGDDADETTAVAELFGHEHRRTVAAYWLRAQPAACTVFEDAFGRRSGACVVARVDRAAPDAVGQDPVLAWALDALRRRRPPEPDEVVLHQIAVDAVTPGTIGVVSDQIAAVSLREWRVRGLGWLVVSTSNEPAFAPQWTYIGLERLGALTVDGIEFAVWARDFSRSPFDEWLAGMGRHELDERGTEPPPVAAPVALSRSDFGDAVHRLLRELHQPGRVRGNPLADSRLVPAGADPGTWLIRRVDRAIAEIGTAPRMQLAARAVDRTYVRPAGSQERAAEVLGVAFSTYRRHLAIGLERLDDLLWDWELHGPPAAAGDGPGEK